MNGQTFAKLVRKRTGTSSVTLPDSELLLHANTAKDDIASLITEKNENYFIIPFLFDLVASDINAREYSLPDEILNNLVSVQLAFDPTKSPLQFVLARSMSLQNAQKITNGLTEANIVNQFVNIEPYYYLARRSLYILSGSIPAVSGGGKAWARIFPADLANFNGASDLSMDPTTTTFGMPRTLHPNWVKLTSIYVKQSRPRPIPLAEDEEGNAADMAAKLDALKQQDLSEEIQGMIPRTTMEGNFGADL